MFRIHSRKSLFTSSIIAVALWGVCSVNVRAAATPTDTFSLSESQKDSLVCSNKTSESCDTITTGKVSAKALFFAGDTNALAAVGLGTDFDITIGNFEFASVIGSGKLSHNSATFALTDVDCAKTPCKTNTHGTVKLQITKKGLSISVSTKTGATADEQFESSVIADDHATDDAAFTDTIDVSIIINGGSSADSFTVGVSGVAATKSTSKNGGSFDLNSVKVKSTGIAH